MIEFVVVLVVLGNRRVGSFLGFLLFFLWISLIVGLLR